MVNYDVVEQKKNSFTKFFCSRSFSSLEEIQQEFNNLWAEMIKCISDQLKYGNTLEKKLSEYMSNTACFCPNIVGLVDRKEEKRNFFKKLNCFFRPKKKQYRIVDISRLESIVDDYLKSIEVLASSMQDSVVNNKTDEPAGESELDSFAADLQAVAADIYAFRNLQRMTLANVDTAISDLSNVFRDYGYMLVTYNGDNEDVFKIMYADVASPIMKTPSIVRYGTNEIVKKGILIISKNK